MHNASEGTGRPASVLSVLHKLTTFIPQAYLRAFQGPQRIPGQSGW